MSGRNKTFRRNKLRAVVRLAAGNFVYVSIGAAILVLPIIVLRYDDACLWIGRAALVAAFLFFGYLAVDSVCQYIAVFREEWRSEAKILKWIRNMTFAQKRKHVQEMRKERPEWTAKEYNRCLRVWQNVEWRLR